MSDAMDSDVREVIRRRIELRERDGHERLLLNHVDLRALLDAADELDRLRAAVRQIADACHWSHDPSGDPEALVAHIGQLQQIAEDTCDEQDRLAAQVERVRALHVRDELGFCVACDYMTPHPCPTRRALDGTDQEDKDGACLVCRMRGQHKMSCSEGGSGQLALGAFRDSETGRFTFTGPAIAAADD